MLFNSYLYIFLFLPTVLLIFFLIGSRARHSAAFAWLVLASLFFYGWWNPAYLGLIVCSIIFNYTVGVRLAHTHQRLLLVAGVTANLASIAYFKYANFFVASLNAIGGTSLHLETIILPLAISFFTFQQIAYLVDAYRGETKEYNFLHYCLFVTFFPQLIAGPIVHHKEMMPQFSAENAYRPNLNYIATGLTVFSIGLFKKVVLADSLALFATPVFDAASDGTALTLLEAWGGALTYSLQLYFDFSGYTDMAIGSALLFGIRLPINFDSPYKSKNIIDFWRRWHITLSRFLRDYLYYALGGNRKGIARRYLNLMLTMLLGGLWHGAGWTFVFWGFLHGFYLCVNHGWHAVRRSFSFLGLPRIPGARYLGVALTFFSVVLAWVFFRAETFDAALIITHAMFRFDDLQLPMQFSGRLGALETLLLEWGIGLNGQYVIHPRVWGAGLPMILFSMILLAMPNSNQIGANCIHLIGKNTAISALVIAFVAAIAILSLGNVSEFLYFQF